MSNTSPHKFAREYDKLMEEYTLLRERATEMILGSFNGVYDETLLQEIEILQAELVAFNKKFMYNIHYVIPDAEFTKH